MEATAPGEMKRSLTLTGVTVNAMALIAPGAFLWTTYQLQTAQTAGSASTAADTWTGLVFALVLAFLTAYSYSELARIYPNAGTGSSYYFAEAAFLDKEKPRHRRWARVAKLSIGWISHLYYWVYPGIMVAFTATLVGYIYTSITGGTLDWLELSAIAVVFALLSGYIAYRGVSGSTNTAIVINVIQITALVSFGVLAIVFRQVHGGSFENAHVTSVVIPHSFMHVLYQSTIAILLLVGFESVTALGAEAVNPQKDIRRGILLSLAIQGILCYLFEYFAAQWVVGSTAISSGAGASKLTGYAAAGASSAPIGDITRTIGDKMLGGTGQALALIMAFTVLLALIGTTLACLNTGVRVTYAMARDKEMPSVLGLLHGRYATPHGGIWVLTAVSALLGVYGVKSVNTLTQITLASNTGTFLVYGMACVVTIVAFAGRHDRRVLKHYAVPGLGLLMNVAELFGVVYLAIKAGGDSSANAYIALGMVITWIGVGALWVAFNPKMRGTKLVYDHRGEPARIAVTN